MSILPVCVSVHYLCILCLQRAEEGDRYPGIGVTGSFTNHVSAGN